MAIDQQRSAGTHRVTYREEPVRTSPECDHCWLAHARALNSLERFDESSLVAATLLATDPTNNAARSVYDASVQGRRVWQTGLDYGYDRWSNHQDWHELILHFKRITAVGAVIGRLYQNVHVSTSGRRTDNLVEIEAFPRFRRGTYADLAAAYGISSTIYPRYRLVADLYQSIGWGLELQGGYRRLAFKQSSANVYVVSISKYLGPWMVTGRTYFNLSPAGNSGSVHGSFRRYFPDGVSYFGARYGYGQGSSKGVNPNQDFPTIISWTLYGEATWLVFSRWVANMNVAYTHEAHKVGGLVDLSLGGGVAYRF